MLHFILWAMLANAGLTVTSTAFINNGNIPIQYTCQDKNINPPLTIGGVPKESKSIVIIVEDPDTQKGTLDHWLVWNISPTAKIEENSRPGVEGKNGDGKSAYMGPCPPDGRHRYFFKVYALDTMLVLKEGSDKATLQRAMKGHILASGELIGLYQKQNVNDMR